MFFMEPAETPYDLRGRILGISVRVHPMFWLVSVVMGWNVLGEGIGYLLAWVVCVFVSILVHELGHVVMGQAFGTRGNIVLYGFGGLAVGSNQLEERWQRILVCFAGPLAGFVFLGVLFVVLWVVDPASAPWFLVMLTLDLGLPVELVRAIGAPGPEPHPMVFFVMEQMVFINLMWGLVNLLPVWPLDGGQISRDVCQGVSPREGLKQSLIISLLVAGLFAVNCFVVVSGGRLLPWPHFGSVYAGILFAVLALQSFQILQQTQARQRSWEDQWDERDYR